MKYIEILNILNGESFQELGNIDQIKLKINKIKLKYDELTKLYGGRKVTKIYNKGRLIAINSGPGENYEKKEYLLSKWCIDEDINERDIKLNELGIE